MSDSSSHQTNSNNPNQTQCSICLGWFTSEEVLPLQTVRNTVRNLIKTHHPQLPAFAVICNNDLSIYRMEYINRILQNEKGKSTIIQQEVVESIEKSELISNNSDFDFESNLTFGQKMADSIAKFGGSWAFILTFLGILVIWIIFNSLTRLFPTYDPYPFILLNLLLSCLAALQAPVIMMSQNRQQAKDRLQSESDYKINLKSELEIRTLHEKTDHLLVDQWEEMGKIQQMQLEIMSELKQEINKLRSTQTTTNQKPPNQS